MDNKTTFWIGQTPNWPRPSEVCRYSLERFGVDVKNIPIYYGDNVSNPFSRTRFLTPVIDKVFSNSQWSLFSDDDFLFQDNPLDLIDNLDDSKAVYVCKHPEYTSKVQTKMDGQKQVNYPKKNWSSFMIFNKNKCNLTFEEVFSLPLSALHQFKWCNEEDIGEIPLEWNWLVGDYEPREDAKGYHYTLGGPWYGDQQYESPMNKIWLDMESEYESI
jgi:hypothetical protein|tara:strand:- start:1023 stop:1670 length:648 start_codon:yes stop_codon:yes gene_type:complete